jgi:hypothetical protein
MASHTETEPLKDSLQKVNDELAVGADLDFQRRWWRFEHIIWPILTAIMIADLLGCFGRGWLANAHRQTKDGVIEVHYERIERYATPSTVSIRFGPAATNNGKVQLWASSTLVKPLGAVRVIPQPTASILDGGGILYTFPVTTTPASVEFELKPTTAGMTRLGLSVPGFTGLSVQIFVMP